MAPRNKDLTADTLIAYAAISLLAFSSLVAGIVSWLGRSGVAPSMTAGADPLAIIFVITAGAAVAGFLITRRK